MGASITRDVGGWEARARSLESRAGAELSSMEASAAHDTLRMPLPGSDKGSLIHMAHSYGMKHFLSQPHALSLMDLWWRGGYSRRGTAELDMDRVVLREGFYLTLLALRAVMPFLNPHILWAESAQAASEGRSSEAGRETKGTSPQRAGNGETPLRSNSASAQARQSSLAPRQSRQSIAFDVFATVLGARAQDADRRGAARQSAAGTQGDAPPSTPCNLLPSCHGNTDGVNEDAAASGEGLVALRNAVDSPSVPPSLAAISSFDSPFRRRFASVTRFLQTPGADDAALEAAPAAAQCLLGPSLRGRVNAPPALVVPTSSDSLLDDTLRGDGAPKASPDSDADDASAEVDAPPRRSLRRISSAGHTPIFALRKLPSSLSSRRGSVDKKTGKLKGKSMLLLLKRAASFYSIPAVKFIVRFVDHMVYLSLWVAMMLEVTRLRPHADVPSTGELQSGGDGTYTSSVSLEPIEVTCLLLTLGRVVEWFHIAGAGLRVHYAHGAMAHGGLSTRLGSRLHAELAVLLRTTRNSRTTQLAMMCTITVILALRISCMFPAPSGQQEGAFQAYQLLVILVVFIQTIEVSFFLILFSKKLGGLILTVIEMLQDIAVFMVIFVLVLVSFTVPYIGLSRMDFYRHAEYDDFHPRGTLSTPLWATFGEFDLSSSSRADAGQWVSMVVLWAYTFVSSILLVNLLIAMFSETYARLMSRAAVECASYQYEKLLELLHVTPTTPPSITPLALLLDLMLRPLGVRVIGERPSLLDGIDELELNSGNSMCAARWPRAAPPQRAPAL